MAQRTKTWLEKYAYRSEPEIKALEKPFAGHQPGAVMLISTPKEIEHYVRSIPTGQSRGIAQMRADLAKAHGVDFTCPLTASMYLRIVSEVALEELDA